MAGELGAILSGLASGKAQKRLTREEQQSRLEEIEFRRRLEEALIQARSAAAEGRDIRAEERASARGEEERSSVIEELRARLQASRPRAFARHGGATAGEGALLGIEDRATRVGEGKAERKGKRQKELSDIRKRARELGDKGLIGPEVASEISSIRGKGALAAARSLLADAEGKASASQAERSERALAAQERASGSIMDRREELTTRGREASALAQLTQERLAIQAALDRLPTPESILEDRRFAQRANEPIPAVTLEDTREEKVALTQRLNQVEAAIRALRQGSEAPTRGVDPEGGALLQKHGLLGEGSSVP